MKKIFLSTILILLFFSNSFSQPKLVERLGEIYIADSTKWRNTLRETYTYDTEGRLIDELEELWFTGRWDWGNANRITYFYNDEGRLAKKIHNNYLTGTDEFQNLNTDTYEYNDNGCLIAEANEIESIHGSYPQYYFTYQVDENCQVLKRIQRRQNVDNTNVFQENIFTYTADSQPLTDSMFIEYNGEMTFYQETLFEYDEKEQIVKKSYLRGSGFTPIDEYEEWQYDENGGVIYFEKWRDSSFNPHQVIEKDEFILEYDERNRLIKRKNHHWRFQDLEPTIYERFEYYCDDILKISRLEELPRNYRFHYKYDVGLEEDCLEDLTDKSIQIFPNPVTDFLIIQSDLLSGRNSQIFIYDALGREFFRDNFFVLENRMQLDVQNLERGIYFLTIENGEMVSTEKFFKN